MKWSAAAGLLIAWLAPAAAGPAESEHFYATRVVSYDPNVGNDWFDDPTAALGGPGGRGPYQSSFHVVTLGQQGSITLGFDEGLVIADGSGADFIVFENPFIITSVPGSIGLTFAELIRVRVSSNGTDFVEFPTWCAAADPGHPFGGIDPSLVGGFAGVTCVSADANDPNNDLDPFDPAQAGGDAFDLDDLRDAPEVLDGRVDLDAIRYVRLVDVLGDGSELDSHGNPVHDAWGSFDMFSPDGPEQRYLPVSADVDAISVIHGAADPQGEPIPGDADEDGDVDYRDYLVLKAHLGGGPGLEWADGDFTRDGCVDRDDFALLRENFGARPGGAGAETAPEPAGALLLAIGALFVRKRRRNGA